MLDFIPFIPFGTPGIHKTIWNTALHSWIFNLTQLLNMQDDVFLNEIMSNTTLPPFVNQVLNQQLNTPVDATLIKYIFLLYFRLASLSSTDNQLLAIENLVTFVLVFGETNMVQVRHIMTKLVTASKSLEHNVISTLSMLIDSVQSMPRLLSKTEILTRAYVLVRVLDALLSSTIHLDVIKSLDTLDQALVTCYQELIPCLQRAVEVNQDNASHAYLIKRSLVSSFNSFADVQFFLPLGYTSSTTDHGRFVEPCLPTVCDPIDWMSEKFLGYIESSGLESPKTAFVDAPLILDWQVEFHITEKLEYINRKRDDERIEFLKLSMEQVKGSNKGTGSWGDHVPKKNKSTLERTFKISQVHDLFPDLGVGFIEACLGANHGHVETVIMQLLENDLPASVAGLDRSTERKPAAAVPQEESVLKSRRNIFDNDTFDIFSHRTVDTSKVYLGKKDKGNADSLLNDKSFIQSEKKNVLQRVVDMYDDDYDDTYDDAGMLPPVENEEAPDIVKKKQQVLDPGVQNESVLVHGFVENPSWFARNGTTRKSTKRAELRKRTGMTDEQLEGWAIMFNRNPRKDKILDKYMLFDGNQTQVSENVSQAQKEPSNKKPPVSEARDHAHKDKNKARYGNHNRKAQRDKKIAKAAPPPS